MISSPDTDVFVIALAKSLEIDANLFMLTGVKSKDESLISMPLQMVYVTQYQHLVRERNS